MTPATGSLYCDLMLSNSRVATISIRPIATRPTDLTQRWAFVITSEGTTLRGTVVTHLPTPALAVLQAVLNEARQPIEVPTSSDTSAEE